MAFVAIRYLFGYLYRQIGSSKETLEQTFTRLCIAPQISMLDKLQKRELISFAAKHIPTTLMKQTEEPIQNIEDFEQRKKFFREYPGDLRAALFEVLLIMHPEFINSFSSDAHDKIWARIHAIVEKRTLCKVDTSARVHFTSKDNLIAKFYLHVILHVWRTKVPEPLHNKLFISAEGEMLVDGGVISPKWEKIFCEKNSSTIDSANLKQIVDLVCWLWDQNPTVALSIGPFTKSTQLNPIPYRAHFHEYAKLTDPYIVMETCTRNQILEI